MRLQSLIVALLAAGLFGCASAQPPGPTTTGNGEVVSATLNIGGSSYSVDWFLPPGNAGALVTVQHGFARNCGNVRETARQIMERGLMALCVNAGMAGGNPALAEALAVTLTSGVTAPDGRALPERIVVGGHSAGGHFASRLGWKLAALAPQRLAGAVLFDPVAAAGFTENLMAVSSAGQRPVLAITANPGGCNAQNNAYRALRQVRQDAIGAGGDGFVGIQLTDRSTHVDIEGSDTTMLAIAACGQGWPRRFNVEALRALAGQWAVDLSTGSRSAAFYPSGSYIETLINASDAKLIE